MSSPIRPCICQPPYYAHLTDKQAIHYAGQFPVTEHKTILRWIRGRAHLDWIIRHMVVKGEPGTR